MMLYFAIAAVTGLLYFWLHDPSGLDYRAREFSRALAEREYERDRQRRQARRALEVLSPRRAA